MIDRVIEWSATHRGAVILIAIAAAAAGWWSLRHMPLDAVPDLSDTQVIVYSRWDRSPDVVDDQVASPIVTALVGAPRVKAVRGVSDFGYSFVYVIFEEGTDLYWARSRTLEYLSPVLPRLPQGVATELGPDATGLGWVFQYVLVDASRTHSLAELRSFQDWYLRTHLKTVRGVADVVSGIVIMRQGENAFDVIARVKDKLRAVEAGLPSGVTVVPIYDRSELIGKSIDTIRSTLIEIMLTVVVVILLFLWHVPSALIPVLTIPIAVLIAFVPFRLLGLSANIMSLGGIAIAIGALVDASIVVVEQTHKKLELSLQSDRRVDHGRDVLDAIKEVGAPSFFALLVIAVSFLPVLTLDAQEGRLFKPLAYTKSLSMIVAAALPVTLGPALWVLFTPP